MGSNISPHPPPSTTTTVVDAIRRIVQSLHEGSRSVERQLGVSGAQYFVLQQLAGRPPVSLNELAALTHTHQSSVSTVVSRLVRRRLVARTWAAADARRLELSITPAGRALIRRAPGVAQTRLIAAIERLAPRKRAVLATLLTDLATATAGSAKAAMFFERPAADASRTRSTRKSRRRPQ